MFFTLIRRTVGLSIVLVLVAVAVPLTHVAHDTVDHHCTLCQLGNSSIGDVIDVQTVTDGVNSTKWVRQTFVGSFDSGSPKPSGSRAPPA